MRRLVKGHGKMTGRTQVLAWKHRGHASAGFIARELRWPCAGEQRVEMRLGVSRGRSHSPRSCGASLRRAPSRAAVSGEIGPRCRNDLLHLAGVAVAMQGEIAAGVERSPRPLARALPPSARIDRSSETRTPSKPIWPRMTSAITRRDNVAGDRRIDRRSRRHARSSPKASRPARETARNRVRASSSIAGLDRRGRRRWLSTCARPWPGICLMTGSTPPSSSPAHTARARRATRSGSLP